ncbi:MAG: hypothetical protein A2902_01715 [Elusimicrobia bacterium RIFCSPLOWO2_01_FULL_64_13]|nr:MAG: hypothetical protein A2902_01715 [Elusimicrobia bacterium RIFCSPLOWO2_01_FULL_64_13]
MAEILTGRGIRDSDVLKTVRRERSQKLPWPVSWVETERAIRVPKGLAVPAMIADLSRSAGKMGLEVLPSPGSEVLLGKKGRVFERLILTGAPPLKKVSGPAVAIVIDDVAGRPKDLEALDDFFALGVPLTFAILPGERSSRDADRKVLEQGQGIILHQPMEPDNLPAHDPGKSALLAKMPGKELRARLERGLKSVPHAAGISNHMGSRFTADQKAMRALFAAMNARKDPLFFFDSRTSSSSFAEAEARAAGIQCLRNGVFLDNEDDLRAILSQFEKLKAKAERDGKAAAIGHIHKAHTVPALRKIIPEFRGDGIEFVFLPELLRMETPRKPAGAAHARPRN